MKLRLPAFPSRIRDKRVLMRVDFNVPVHKGKVEDDLRIQKTLPSIKKLLSRQHAVILMTHMEKEDGSHPSLLPVAAYLKRHGIRHLSFASRLEKEYLQKRTYAMKSGEVLLLENLRKDPREKKNSVRFAEDLASFADVFVNEAFSASHREHASIVGVPRFIPHYAGPLFIEEVKALCRAFRPPHPFVLILGGRKPIKFKLLARFLRKADTAVVGGVIANTLFHKKGIEVGRSIIENEIEDGICRKILRSQKVLLPKDVEIERNGKRHVVAISEIEENDAIYDVGPDTIRDISQNIMQSRFVLWNGPLGYTEKGYEKSSRALVKSITTGTRKSIVGGGDTIAFLNQHALVGKFPFVSTGGGAMLEFLAEGTLPGIEALQMKNPEHIM